MSSVVSAVRTLTPNDFVESPMFPVRSLHHCIAGRVLARLVPSWLRRRLRISSARPKGFGPLVHFAAPSCAADAEQLELWCFPKHPSKDSNLITKNLASSREPRLNQVNTLISGSPPWTHLELLQPKSPFARTTISSLPSGISEQNADGVQFEYPAWMHLEHRR